MIPLYREPRFTFRFAERRVVGRFHLEGVGAGRAVAVFRLDAAGGRPGLLATAVVGDGGWVDLAEPVAVSAEAGFVAEVAAAVAGR